VYLSAFSPEAIKTILDGRAKDCAFELTDVQKKEIAESKKQVQEGFFYNDLLEEISKVFVDHDMQVVGPVLKVENTQPFH